MIARGSPFGPSVPAPTILRRKAVRDSSCESAHAVNEESGGTTYHKAVNQIQPVHIKCLSTITESDPGRRGQSIPRNNIRSIRCPPCSKWRHHCIGHSDRQVDIGSSCIHHRLTGGSGYLGAIQRYRVLLDLEEGECCDGDHEPVCQLAKRYTSAQKDRGRTCYP